MVPKSMIVLLAGSALAASPAVAESVSPAAHGQSARGELQFVPGIAPAEARTSEADQRLAIFTPTTDPVRTTIDYGIWDYALKHLVISMGPSDRQGARRPDPISGTRRQQGPQSRYRLEGSMVMFRFFDRGVIQSFTEYRQDLERVVETHDIAALPRNEQLAFWLNLHNVALMEQIAREWPVREPKEITIDGVPLDDAKFITLRGIPVSLRDIRENIVFRHWKDPKVIYGFWRGEIGMPHLQTNAFTGSNVGPLLEIAAADFVNSLRGTQKISGDLAVSELYAQVARFYFPDFEKDVRAHLAAYAEEPVAKLIAQTDRTVATLREHDISDLHGGALPANYLFVNVAPGSAAADPGQFGCTEKMGQAACDLLYARALKLDRMERRGQPVSRVFFSNIDLPGDPPNKNAVE